MEPMTFQEAVNNVLAMVALGHGNFTGVISTDWVIAEATKLVEASVELCKKHQA